MSFEEELAHGLYRYVELLKNNAQMQSTNKQWLFIQFKENLTGYLSYGICYENFINHLIKNEKYNFIILENPNCTEKELCDIIGQKLKELKMLKKLDIVEKDFK